MNGLINTPPMGGQPPMGGMGGQPPMGGMGGQPPIGAKPPVGGMGGQPPMGARPPAPPTGGQPSTPPSPMPGQAQQQQDPIQAKLQMYEQRIAQLERMLMGKQGGQAAPAAAPAAAQGGQPQGAINAPPVRQQATPQAAQDAASLTGNTRMNASSQSVYSRLTGG